jgi:C-terminal peptidase prc
LWRIVRDTYLYPDFNGLDWEAIGDEYRHKVEAGLTYTDFYAAMEEMISRLGDDHSVFLPPEEASAESAEFAGENDYVGIGVLTKVVTERKRLTILVVFPDSPAERAGLQPHDNILAVDGEAVVDEDGYRRNLLRGPENTTITLTVQTPGEAPRQVDITRQRVSGAVPVPYRELTTPKGKRVGYILLVTFADETVDDQVERALKALTAEAPLDGVILDNRQNSGGADEVARGVLGFFTSGTLGHFVDRDNRRRAFNIIGSDINGSMSVPLVVMVGSGTASFGEIFAGVLKDSGRAYIIGETTEGNIELLWGYEFEDGSRAWIAHETFRPRRHPNDNWEQSGIVPDLTVAVNWDEVTLESDAAIQAALEYLDGIK